MDDFNNIYEKLIDMGFKNYEIDAAIKKGLYSFDTIFNELLNTDVSLLSRNETTDFDQIEQTTQPVLKLKWNQSHLSDVMTIQDNEDINNGSSEYQNERISGTNCNKALSSTLSSSILSTSLINSSNKKIAKIQIMDLLDPSNEPVTFSHPFLSSICTIRDIICWFHKCRNSTSRLTFKNADTNSCRLAVSPDTSLHLLIEMFQQLKWHLVMPSGAQSKRIYGDEYLDTTLECLGLYPSAHLLAIISCPLDLKNESKFYVTPSTQFYSKMSTSPDNILTIPSLDSNNCCVNIRMINYRNNPLYLQGKSFYSQIYNPKKTTLQRIAVDFSSFCQMNLASFTLLQMQPRRRFSYPDDYLLTLYDLGLDGDVTLYCHSVSSVVSENNDNNHFANNNSDYLESNIDVFNTSGTEVVGTNETRNSSSVLPFSGVGIPLSGSLTNKTVAEIWKDRQPNLPIAQNDLFDHPVKNVPKTLHHLSFQEIYCSIKLFHSIVCKSVKKLPNNIQHSLIKQLIHEQLLVPNILTFFCSPGTCLTSLDLSYTILATNEILKCISRCASLQELVLDNEEHVFSNEGLWHLRSCLSLRRLSLNYCSKINDWGIQVVGVLPELSILAIKYTSVTNVGLKHIYLHLNSESESVLVPKLKSLDLTGLTISDECLSSLGVFQQLELLNLSSTHISNPSLLPYLPELRHIDISHCQDLVWEKQAHIKSLSESFPKLSSINVRGVSNSNLVHLTMAISHCKNLTQIDGIFCHSQMTASLAASLSHLPLETVILTNCRHVTDLWLPVLARFSETLTHLVLSSCSSITGENNSLANNLGRLRNLSWLDLTHLENVSGQQMCQLVLGQNFPKMKVCWISLTDMEEINFKVATKNLHFKVNISRSFCSSSN